VILCGFGTKSALQQAAQSAIIMATALKHGCQACCFGAQAPQGKQVDGKQASHISRHACNHAVKAKALKHR
jgi:hypothetical protein